MSARKVSREPYRVGRSRREIWVAVGVALAIVLVTAVAVWILAPSDDSPSPVVTPSVTSPSDTAATTDTTVPATDGTTGTTTAPATTDTTAG